MKIRFRHIVLMILLLLAGRMAAQVPVLDSVCVGTVRNYRVDGQAGSTYSWILTPPAGPFIVLPSDADTVQIAWNYPSGVYQLECTQHGENGCDADVVFGQVYIFDQPLVDAGDDGTVCVDSYYKLIDATAQDCSSVLWETNGDGTFNDNTMLNATYTPGPNDNLTGFVQLKLAGFGMAEDGGCDPSYSYMMLYIVTEIVPQFDSIGPLCQFITPPALPDTSLENIYGYWTPPVINTDFLGIFPYTFHPWDTSSCAVDTTIMITITDLIVPTFDQIGPLCINITPPELPDESNEGITGTWDPPVITTDVPGTFTFIFTPNDSTQCGEETSMDISVVTEMSPEFDPIGPLCQFDLAPPLPDTSLNGIGGTWDPPFIDTSIPGIYQFTFTPGPDQCGLDTIIEITILQHQIPVFEPIDTLCQYSTAPILPDTSLNGITGTWDPAWISTAVPGTFTFTFTPDDPLQCGETVMMDITILPELIAEFDIPGTLCQFSTPPVLPDTSLNGIPGTWVPPVINTDVLGTFFFTFTPDDTIPCAMQYNLVINIVSEIIPEFDSIGPYCQNSVPPALPAESNEGITGTWDPPVINTTVTGTFTYVFTPDDNQCAVETSIFITITDEIVPVFDTIGPLCQNIIPPDLPLISNNNITGTWDPPVIDTSTPGTFTFTFTPDNPEQCGVETTMDITVVISIIPEFDPIGPLCQNITPPDLPLVSNNNITGTWDPATIDTGTPGTFTYTFTPDDPQQCGEGTTMDITIVTGIDLVFSAIGPLCQNSTAPALPVVSNNIPPVPGTWTPPAIDTSIPGVTSYIFTPQGGYCADPYMMQIEIIATPQITMVTSSDPHCGNPDGEIIIAATSPSGYSLEYSVDNGVTYTSGNIFNNLAEGIYNIRVKDEYGCESAYYDNPVSLEDVPGPVVSQVIVTDETDSQQNGSIEIIATANTALIYYSINSGATWQTNNGLFVNLSAGTYPCVVKDENNCDTSFTVVVENIFLTPLEAITQPGGHCVGDVAIVPIIVDHFIEVASFQLKLKYNVDELFCVGVNNINNQLFSGLSSGIDIQTGLIVISWHSPAPVTFPMATVLELFFVPNQPGQGQLDWYTSPGDSYFYSLTGTPIPATFFTAPMIIYDPPEIQLQLTKTVCEGDQVELIGAAITSAPPLVYEWTLPNGQTQAINPFMASVTQADGGLYTLHVTDSLGCTDQKTIMLIVSENPVAAFHGEDTLTVPEGYYLDAGPGMASYEWNTGETSESIRIIVEGMYSVEMISKVFCVGKDSVYVKIMSEEIPTECLFIPNAFTPNSDGLNDTFEPVAYCPVYDYKMQIYNRWGELLFESNDISIGWDGKKHGKFVPGDAYVYKISYRTDQIPAEEMAIVKTGVVMVVVK